MECAASVGGCGRKKKSELKEVYSQPSHQIINICPLPIIPKWPTNNPNLSSHREIIMVSSANIRWCFKSVSSKCSPSIIPRSFGSTSEKKVFVS